MSARAELFAIPSAAALVRQACTALYDGRSVVIVLPHPLTASALWEQIVANEPLRSEREVASFSATPCDKQAPTQQLAMYYGAEHNILDAILDAPGVPDVLQLTGFDGLSQADRRTWLDLVQAWSAATHRRANIGKSKKPIVVLLNSAEYLPPTDLYLDRLFGVVPSPIELRMLCAQSIQQHAIASRLWRESLLPELAGQDIELLDQLSDLDDELLTDVATIVRLLTAYGEKLGWDRELGAVNGAPLPEEALIESLRPSWLSLWSKGILCRSSEHSWTYHSAFLALQGKQDLLKHRLWRGQARLILPMLDDFRRSLCDYLTNRTPNWFTQVGRTSFEGDMPCPLESPYDAEWLDLYRPLERCNRGIAIASDRARRIRNQIAHYNIIPFREFNDFWRDRKIARVTR